MTILLLTDADVFAGTERHMLDLARGLRVAGGAVVIGCPAAAVLAARAGREGIDCVAIEKRGPVGWAAVMALAGMLRRGEVDLIHAHNGRTALQATLAKAIAGRGAVVLTQHFITPSRARRRGPKRLVSNVLHAWVRRRVDHDIAISSAVRAAMLDRGDADPRRMTLVHNGIVDPAADAAGSPDAARADLGVPPDAPLIVCAARLQPEKDVATLVSAMAQVAAQNPAARCVIAGRGAEEAALRRQIDELGLAERVRLLGFRDDVRRIMAAADVFVLPAPAEPFGLVLLEAMALGRPVVAVRAGGPLDIIEDGATGMLVPPGDAATLASALGALVSDPDRRRRLGEAGRRRFEERFTAEHMAAATLAVYRAVSPGGDRSTRSRPLNIATPSSNPSAPGTGATESACRGA